MGIYTSGNIFGIKIYNMINRDSNILYNKEYPTIMTKTQLEEAYLFYKELNDKYSLRFLIYTECTIICDNQKNDSMIWYPISLNEFLRKFNLSN